VLAAVASNTLSKLAIAAAIGRGRFAAEVAVVSVASIIAASAALWLVVMLVGA
jgi:uncharacterized membrane protein (DUF4010 family)